MAQVTATRTVTYRVDDGDLIEVNGRTFKVSIEADEAHEAPWNDGDGRGIVSGWTTRAKEPGERVLQEDRRSRRYFDWAGTMRKAKAEGWNVEPYNEGTKAQKAERAVQREFDRFRQWCSDQWSYVRVVVTLLEGNEDDGYTEGESHSLRGLESDDTQGIAETARELAEELAR